MSNGEKQLQIRMHQAWLSAHPKEAAEAAAAAAAAAAAVTGVGSPAVSLKGGIGTVSARQRRSGSPGGGSDNGAGASPTLGLRQLDREVSQVSQASQGSGSSQGEAWPAAEESVREIRVGDVVDTGLAQHGTSRDAQISQHFTARSYTINASWDPASNLMKKMATPNIFKLHEQEVSADVVFVCVCVCVLVRCQV